MTLAQVGLWRTLAVRLCSVAREDLKEMLRIMLTSPKKLLFMKRTSEFRRAWARSRHRKLTPTHQQVRAAYEGYLGSSHAGETSQLKGKVVITPA